MQIELNVQIHIYYFTPTFIKMPAPSHASKW